MRRCQSSLISDSRSCERDFPDQGLRVRGPQVLRGWLTAYAAATSTTASYTTLLHAATPGEADKPARGTTIAYRDDAGLATRPPDVFQDRASPKHHLADPALAAALLASTLAHC